MAERKSTPANYENNPFFIASNGVSLLFNLARNASVVLLILSLIRFSYGNTSGAGSDPRSMMSDLHNTAANWTGSDWAIAVGTVLIIGLAIAMISTLFSGAMAYIASRLAQNKRTGVTDSLKVSFDLLWSYLWLKIIIFVKVLLWSLLFIVPGVIMAVRYSLADIAFFDERKNLRGNAAVKESLRLTKGAWITTFASSILFNTITLNALTYVVMTGNNAVLYRQFDKLDNNKPAAHWLSWTTLGLIIALIVLAFFALGYAILNYATTF